MLTMGRWGLERDTGGGSPDEWLVYDGESHAGESGLRTRRERGSETEPRACPCGEVRQEMRRSHGPHPRAPDAGVTKWHLGLRVSHSGHRCLGP